jgi:hypothetical protein
MRDKTLYYSTSHYNNQDLYYEYIIMKSNIAEMGVAKVGLDAVDEIAKQCFDIPHFCVHESLHLNVKTFILIKLYER